MNSASIQVDAANGISSRLTPPWIWDSVGYFGGKVIPGVTGLLSVTIFIRLIGVAEFGRLAVLLPILMAIGSACSGWLAQGILRFHPGGSNSESRTFHRAVTRGSLYSLFAAGFLVTGLLLFLHYEIASVVISLAFCSTLVAYSILLSKLQAEFRPGLVLRQEAIRSIAALALPVILILISGSRKFEWIILGQSVAYGIALVLVPRRRSSKIEGGEFAQNEFIVSSNRASIGQLWMFGWAVGAWLLLSQLLPVIDRSVIQRFTGYASAGTYASLYEICVRSLSFLLFPLTQAAHPRIMRMWNADEFSGAYRIIRQSILGQCIIFAGIFSVVSFKASWITTHILGFADDSAARTLPVLVLGGFLWQLALLLHKPMEIAKQTVTMLTGISLALAINLICCFVFIPRFGYSAAAYILVFSGLCYGAFTLIVTRFSIFLGREPSRA